MTARMGYGRFRGITRKTAIVVVLLALHGVIAVLSIRDTSCTIDEHRHFLYGVRCLSGDFRCIDDSKMPVSILNALPYYPEIVSSQDAEEDFRADTLPGRYVTILFSVLLGALVYRWSSLLYGTAGGLLSLTLYAFSPSMLAHGRLVTTDLSAALTATLAAYTYWRFLSHPRPRSALLTGCALGLAQIAKFSAVLLVPIFLAVAVVRLAPDGVHAVRHGGARRLGRGLLAMGMYAGLILVMMLLIINAGYLFTGTGERLEDYQFMSEEMKVLQSSLGFAAGLPVPLPHPYLKGIDWVKFGEGTRSTMGPSYLLGECRIGRFDSYYPLAFLFKVPIGAQLIILLALARLLWRFREFHFHRNEAFLILPLLGYGSYFTFLCNAQPGIRLALMVLPLLHVLGGSLLRDVSAVGPRMRWVVGLSLIYLVVSVLSYFPHFIPYFNELVPDRKNAWRVLADSNLDWGQNEKYVERYLKDHPGTHANPRGPVTGSILISANQLLGIDVPPRDCAFHRWMRENLEPTDHVAYAHLVFEVPSTAFDEACGGVVTDLRKARGGTRVPGYRRAPRVTSIRIHEFLTENWNGIPDEMGEREGWIELGNLGSSAVTVGGMYLTNDLARPTKWTIPANTMIPAGGTLLVWADGEPLEGPLHASFALDAGEGMIGLFDRDGSTLLDGVAYRGSICDVSVGQLTLPHESWFSFPLPTPRSVNRPPETGGFLPYLGIGQVPTGPFLMGIGLPRPGGSLILEGRHAPSSTAGLLCISVHPLDLRVASGGNVLVSPVGLSCLPFMTTANGTFVQQVPLPGHEAIAGVPFFSQMAIVEDGTLKLSNGLIIRIGK